MENLKNIQVLQKGLEHERDKLRFEFSKVTQMIAKRRATITKITQYQKEYANPSHLMTSRETPALAINLNLFSAKIFAMIAAEQMEVVKLENIKSSMLQSLHKLEQKIQLMSVFETRAHSKQHERIQKQESRLQDDLASTTNARGDL